MKTVRLIAFVLVSAANLCFAAQPVRFNYQAKLTTTSGAPLQGTHLLFVSVWDGGTGGVADSGISVYSETASVPVADGVVNHVVGEGVVTGGTLDDTVFASSNDIFLQVAVDSVSNVVLPRTRLESVPFAVRARAADNGLASGLLVLSEDLPPPAGYSPTGGIVSSTWIERAKMPTGRQLLGVAAANGKVYAIGGLPSAMTKVNEAYDPATDSWVRVADMTTARGGLTCTEVNGLIYAVGGGDLGATFLTTNEVYDAATNTWSPQQPLITARRFHSAAAAEGKIYVFGGSTLAGLTSSVEAYDPGVNQWAVRAPMPEAKQVPAVAAVNGKIYVIGGFTGSNSMANDEYDTVMNTWASKAACPAAISSAQAIGLDGKVYLIGGAADQGAVSTMRVYDPGTNAWSVGVPLPVARLDFGATLLNGRIYAIGGGDPSASNGRRNDELTPGQYFVLTKD